METLKDNLETVTSTVLASKDIRNLEISLVITKIYSSRKLCSVTVGINGNKVNLRNVRINPLLLYQLESDSSSVSVNKEYVSINNSNNYGTNPLKLVKYKDKLTGDIKYYITRVSLAKSTREKVSNSLMKGIVYTRHYYAPRDWYRYIDTTVKGLSPRTKPIESDSTFVDIKDFSEREIEYWHSI
jgi:hypothetical protein